MKTQIYFTVLLAFVAVLSVPAYAVDNGSVQPVTYYNPDTGKTSPFFPIGSYSWLYSSTELLNLKNFTGGNTVHFADVDITADYALLLENLDIAHANGMKVTIAIKRELLDNVDASQPDVFPATRLRDMVNFVKHHPAILAWHLGDENNNDAYAWLTPEDVSNCAAVIHQVDPNRQVSQVFGNIYDSTLLPYTNGTDIVCTDNYEYHNGDPEFDNAAGHLNDMHESVQTAQSQNQGYVNVAQGMGFSAGPETRFRLPTAAEYRYEAYSSIASAGSRGILDWIYVPESYGWYTDYAEYTEYAENTVKPVYQELADMQHGLETGYEAGSVALGWNETPAEAAAWSNDFDRLSQLLVYDDEQDKYFLIVTNNSTDSRNMQAIISGLPKELAGLSVTSVNGESLTLTDLGGGSYQLNDSLNHHEADVYMFDAAPKVDTAVHYTFRETAPGTWEVLVDVVGDDTAGLSAYEIWVDGVDPTSVSFAENNLGSGFASLLQGDAGGNFNAGNYQGLSAAIDGIGMVAINEAGVVLDAQALLGILSTEEGLTEANFRTMVVGLLNSAGDGFLDADGIIPTLEVIPIVVFLLGDANGDGVVSAGDYASVQANFGNTGSVGGGLLGDANGDGVVSAGDYASVQANFGNTAATQVIPEPVMVGLLSLGGLVLIKRKRK